MKKIEKITNADVYFCDPASPTQKPIVERMNRDIRHWLPKGTDFNKINQNRINWIIQTINLKIRRCLNWKTPQELFFKYLK